MLVKELLSTRTEPIEGCGVEFFVNNEIIMHTDNYPMVAPLFDNFKIKHWGFDWDSQSLEIELVHWDAKDFEQKTKPYVFVNSEPTEETKRLLGWGDEHIPGPDYCHSDDAPGIGLESLPTQMPSKYDNLDIRNLSLRRGCINRLNGVGILSVGELREFTAKDLLSIEKFGKRYLQEVRNALSAYGLHLKEED